MKTYQVRGIDLHHDGQRYPEGSLIELGDQEASAKRRWLEPVVSQAQPEAAPAKQARAGKSGSDGQDSGQGEGAKQ